MRGDLKNAKESNGSQLAFQCHRWWHLARPVCVRALPLSFEHFACQGNT